MKLVLVPMMFSIAVIGFTNRDKILDVYHSAYPTDPAKTAALERCAARDPAFNRLDPDDRERCYRGVGEPEPIAFDAGYNPSHLPGNDIRRQQSNERPLAPVALQTALARPVVPVPSSAPVSAAPATTPHPFTAVHRVAVSHPTAPVHHTPDPASTR